MICEPINTEAPRFRVITIEGYPITPYRHGGNAKPVLVATVLDSFYGTEHGRFASNDLRARGRVPRRGDAEYGPVCACGKPKGLKTPKCRDCTRYRTTLGREDALAAAAERCAELNDWHEREGWGEHVPLTS